jgi:hypothetical protein
MKEEILIKNQIIPEEVNIYHGETWLGQFNEYEFNDLRIRIMEKYKGEKRFVTDYYVYKNDTNFYIDSQGRIEGWSYQFFDMIESQLRKLLET